MKRFFLITALLFAQVALAEESKFVDDAPKGFIHVREESDGVESHDFIRADCVVRLLQISEEDAGKMRHYIRLYTTGTEGSSHDIESATREEAEKVRGRLLEILSAATAPAAKAKETIKAKPAKKKARKKPKAAVEAVE
ncbi:hypothetical protein OJ996_23200 [Luteolibacter sp. GHJ8]|uniref:Uncharacterized protein n=1 Tax=Luteolibacter rhizosphaerae TaxID=2989719 RepID=A0ABT3G9I4_9BACT|nr:hypothetical protein [Luteolibacter rhizosphaerae]MCW1916513.1 hypothetical protein [Luteolibacter rhizosphaerae]